MPDHPEWYRAWRHDEREIDARLAASPMLRWLEAARQAGGAVMLIGAIILMVLSIRDAVGW